MKRWISGILLSILLLGAFGCSADAEAEAVIKNTFEETPSELIGESIEKGNEIVLKTYYEMSDGTWKTDDGTYQYRLVITGRLNGAVKDTTYTILSNTKDITFERAWKASGLSSNINDYFKPGEAVFAAIK